MTLTVNSYKTFGFEVAMCVSYNHLMVCREGLGELQWDERRPRASTPSLYVGGHTIIVCMERQICIVRWRHPVKRFLEHWLRKSTSLCTPLQPTNQPIYSMSSSWQVEPFSLEKLACKLRRPAPSHASLAASYQEEYFLQRIQCFYSVRH